MWKHEQAREQIRTGGRTNHTKHSPRVQPVMCWIGTGTVLIDPARLLSIQRQAGNSATALLFQGSSGSITSVQRDGPSATDSSSPWSEEAKKARTALAGGNRGVADGIYRKLILRAASAARLPKDPTQPGLKDILIDFDLTEPARTKGKEVSKNPDHPWHWISFGKEAVMETQGYTEMIITHELIHVEQYQHLWNSYKQSVDKKTSWDDYLEPFNRRTLVEGPDELEAGMTALRFIQRLSREEQQTALRQLFGAYVRTSLYKPSKNELLVIDPIAARSQILDFYAKAQKDLQDQMGNALWWSLIDVDEKDAWMRVLKDLKPIARKGYSNASLRPAYNDILKANGLDFAKMQ